GADQRRLQPRPGPRRPDRLNGADRWPPSCRASPGRPCAGSRSRWAGTSPAPPGPTASGTKNLPDRKGFLPALRSAARTTNRGEWLQPPGRASERLRTSLHSRGTSFATRKRKPPWTTLKEKNMSQAESYQDVVLGSGAGGKLLA